MIRVASLVAVWAHGVGTNVVALSISTPPTMTTPSEGVIVADKSPNQHNAKKVGKSLKEKRNDKHAKKESKKGLLGEKI
jgi:hypothetical protein